VLTDKVDVTMNMVPVNLRFGVQMEAICPKSHLSSCIQALITTVNNK
jgi:hypothetical protein